MNNQFYQQPYNPNFSQQQPQQNLQQNKSPAGFLKGQNNQFNDALDDFNKLCDDIYKPGKIDTNLDYKTEYMDQKHFADLDGMYNDIMRPSDEELIKRDQNLHRIKHEKNLLEQQQVFDEQKRKIDAQQRFLMEEQEIQRKQLAEKEKKQKGKKQNNDNKYADQGYSALDDFELPDNPNLQYMASNQYGQQIQPQIQQKQYSNNSSGQIVMGDPVYFNNQPPMPPPQQQQQLQQKQQEVQYNFVKPQGQNYSNQYIPQQQYQQNNIPLSQVPLQDQSSGNYNYPQH